MPQLQTNWIRIATAGNAIDGRKIDESILKDMADTYNPDEYTARIWPDHRRWFGAWGDVVAVKAEEWQGKLRLFAKLRPNSQLMQANEMDQKAFCSIELDIKDFDGTGKYYLAGLGVTDEPGSLGTEKLKFNKSSKTSFYAEPEPFQIEEVADVEEGKEPSRFRKLMSYFKTGSIDESQQEEQNVEKEQFDQLMAGIKGVSDKQEKLETRFSTFEQNQNKPEENEVNEPEGDEGSAIEGNSENFSKLITAVQGIATKQDELATKFNKLEQEIPGQKPGEEGNGSQTVEAI
ncbi:capsid protein [Vibrio sp. 03-59-1]|uniref:GPO family capsid scaffolding protein n=1 Tax=Vibrio sp. 03-59-1 TaxID=2607607 RepID=UPI001493829B|nr:GPO family capsid scaffolding protein [Vibrio sp. 03-59-1]NOH82837.1 capsid protein [Vibrio sp. 03-59-1]